MQQILNNPYRIAGLLVGATAAEQRRQLTRLQRFLEADQEPQDDFSFPTLGNLTRTLESVEEAASKLNLDSDKINAALFWFWNGNPITDEAAFDALKEGDTDTAIEIWQKLTEDAEEVTKRNASAFHNLSTLYLSGALEGINTKEVILEQGISLKLKFLESDFIKDFKTLATDETYKTTKKELQLLLLNILQSEIRKNKEISSAKFFYILKRQVFTAKEDFWKGFAQGLIEQIEQKIETTKTKRKTNKANADKAGSLLSATTLVNLMNLREVLEKSDVKYSSIADKVANELLQCSIDYFNDSQEKDSSSDYAEIAIKLAKRAKSSAVGNFIKQKIQETLKDLIVQSEIRAIIQILEGKKNKKNEFDHLLDRLGLDDHQRQAFKAGLDDDDYIIYKLDESTYIRKAKSIIEKSIPRLTNIKAILKSSHETYLALSTNIAAMVQSNIIEAVNDSQNHHGILSYSNTTSIISEAWNITQQVNSLDMKLEFQNHYKKNKATLKSLCNQVGVKANELNYAKIPELNFIIHDSEITSTDEKSKPLTANPLYHKYTRFIGLKLNVIAFESQEIEFFIKYVNNKGGCSQNPKISPKGFTKSLISKITPNTQMIDLGGWGNSESCTYTVGTHSIEVWVSGCMIHKKEFKIELSPSQKIEEQIKSAERKLAEINNTEYFSSEIKSARNIMTEIKKFQLFRSGSTKQKQIEGQQLKIDGIIKKSKDKQNEDIKAIEEKIEKLKLELSKAEY